MRKDAIAIFAAGATFAGAMTASAQVAPTATPAQPQVTPALPGAPAAPAAPGAPAPGATPIPGTLPTLPAVPAQPGAIPALPGAAATTQQSTTIVTTTPGLPALPGAPVAPGGLPGLPGAAAANAVPTPPPLGELSPEAADVAADTTASISTTAAPSQLYTFLFIDDPEYGVVRQKFETDVAENVKEQEIQRLMQERLTQGTQGAGGYGGLNPVGYGAAMDPALMGAYDPMMGGGGYDPMMGAGYDPSMAALTGGVPGQTGLNNTEATRAAAEWDFYYAQLEMYDTYVREQLIPNAQDLPTLGYTAENALQERQDLFESFQEGAIAQNNDDFNDNKMFYERLQRREDRRLAYYQWVQLKHKEVAEWAEVWARQVFGTRWADGEEVRIDDWYYGTDFNSAQPVLVAIDDREYIVSKQPVDRLQDGQLNVISNNFTPYDIIDANGTLKNPVMETLRGTLVVPPAGPILTEDTTGTIEIVGSVETE